jgi:hypothetical protein
VTAQPQSLELYRRGRWQYSVLEEPAARACGPLPGVAIDADFGTAEAALLDLIERSYGLRCRPHWEETDEEWWVAEVEHP